MAACYTAFMARPAHSALRRRLIVLVLAAAVLNAAPGDPGTSVLRPAGLPADWDAEPLGWVRVTNYSHVETRSRLTASGYRLYDRDEGVVCAISRDWWRSRVRPGELVWVVGFAEPCVALDTMALANRKGFSQTRWIDVYVNDRRRGLAFGIQRSAAYVVRPAEYGLRPLRTPVAARDLRRRVLALGWRPSTALGRPPPARR